MKLLVHLVLVSAWVAFADSRRPYEMDWAGRTEDDRAPLCALTTGKGWNHVRIVLPRGGRWGASFCPVSGTNEHPCEVEDLEYSSDPQNM